MKKLILSFLIFFSFSPSVFSSDYSLFYEEDAKSVMIIYYDDGLLFGEIISFGGYDWFRRTYSNRSELVGTYIQPTGLGVSGKMSSYMQQRYLINNFKHSFRFEGQDQILTFSSKEAFQIIVGFLTRGEIFDFASRTEKTWYAGTFIPIKEKDDLIKLANENQMTFCMLMEVADKINGKNVNLKTNNIRRLMSESNLNCNKNYLLQ